MLRIKRNSLSQCTHQYNVSTDPHCHTLSSLDGISLPPSLGLFSSSAWSNVTCKNDPISIMWTYGRITVSLHSSSGHHFQPGRMEGMCLPICDMMCFLFINKPPLLSKQARKSTVASIVVRTWFHHKVTDSLVTASVFGAVGNVLLCRKPLIVVQEWGWCISCILLYRKTTGCSKPVHAE